MRLVYRGVWGTHSVTSSVPNAAEQVRTDCGLVVPDDLVEVVDDPLWVVTCEPCLEVAMTTEAVRLFTLDGSCHRIGQERPDGFGQTVTSCGMLVPWRASRWGLASEVDCRRCLDEVRRQTGEQGSPS